MHSTRRAKPWYCASAAAGPVAALAVTVGASLAVYPAVAQAHPVKAAARPFPKDLCSLALQPEVSEMGAPPPCVGGSAKWAVWGDPYVYGARWLAKYPPGGVYLELEVWTGPNARQTNFERAYKGTGAAISLGSWAREGVSAKSGGIVVWEHGFGITAFISVSPSTADLPRPNVGTHLLELVKAVMAQA